MKIELIGWDSEGLRCPDVKIDLMHNGKVAPIALLQMPNGTGKTTTLNMLRAALNGEAVKWDANRIRVFRRPGENTEKGVFAVHLLIDDRPLTFELTLDFDEGKAKYRTTSTADGGISHGWNPPAKIHRFFTENFVRLFVFDGEFAERLLDSRESEAEKAIDALCQLYLLEDIAREAEQTWQQATRNRTATTEQGLARYINTKNKLDKQIGIVVAARKQSVENIEVLTSEVTTWATKIAERASQQKHLKEQYDAKNNQKIEAQNEVDRITLEVMALVRQPQTLSQVFVDELVEVKSQLDRLKLPSSTSSQFFVELLDEAECICGRPMTEEAKETIQKRSERYLGAETSGVLNSLKHDIDSLVMQDESSGIDDLQNALEKLDAAVTVKTQLDTYARTLWDQLIAGGGDELIEWERTLREKEKKLEQLQTLLDEIDREHLEGDNENTMCYKSLRKQLREVNIKISEITGTLELREQTSILQKIVSLSMQKARKYIRDGLTQECNDRLATVLARSPLRVESIERSLKLKGQEGASVGQTLSVGYTFLTNLLHRGQHQFPLVIDSPANPVDILVRREIGKLIPELCEQFVGFTISSEREGFVSSLDGESNGNIKYMTMFRKGPGTHNLIDGLESFDVEENDTCVLVHGKEYFNRFDLEEEPTNAILSP